MLVAMHYIETKATAHLEHGSRGRGRDGTWAWSSDFWDWDHDGFSDLYVCNGYLTGPKEYELAGFFWRQVVAKSPEDARLLSGTSRAGFD